MGQALAYYDTSPLPSEVLRLEGGGMETAFSCSYTVWPTTGTRVSGEEETHAHANRQTGPSLSLSPPDDSVARWG
jgi:hypothetical protein